MFFDLVMFLYLWPAIVFYGIKDKVVWKLQKLFRPFFTQWQSSRTKRKRNTLLTGWLHEHVQYMFGFVQITKFCHQIK